MRRKLLPLLVFVCILLFSSCTSTSEFVQGIYADPEVPVEEKFEAGGGVHLTLSLPESYFDAKDFLVRFTELVREAEDYIIITTFLGSASAELDELYQAIAEKAASGVDVYMIIDGISSYDMTASAEHMYPVYFLRESGVKLLEYHPLSILNLVNPATIIIRDHRKMVVVDGRYAVLGGMNMNYISMGAEGIDLQRDSMYVFDSPSLSRALVEEFVTIWNEASVKKISISDFAQYGEEEKGTISGWLFNQGPGNNATMAAMYSSLFSSAKEEIFMLPYLAFFDENMYASLEAALERGVKVTICLPIDSREYVQGALFYDYHNLVEAGFDVYLEYTGEETGLSLLHQKLCVVDGRYTVIGSSNINYRSMGLSYEIALVLDDKDFAAFSIEQGRTLQNEMFLLDEETALRLNEEDGNVFFYLFSYYGG